MPTTLTEVINYLKTLDVDQAIVSNGQEEYIIDMYSHIYTMEGVRVLGEPEGDTWSIVDVELMDRG